jgi:DNA polymerase III alpha subunit (gram-positive type)
MIGPNDRLCVFDVEADGINPSKIHCLTAAVYSMGEWRIKSTTDYDEMRKFFTSSDVLIGHNIYRWDIPVVQRLLGIKVTAQIVDTLALSWYLYPTQGKHGLESWGEHFGVPKPKVDDWDNLPIEEYIHRCEEDVKINCKLWDKQLSNLCTLYGSKVKKDKAYRFIDYLMFKMETAAKAEASRWKLDVERCEEGLKILEADVEEKVNKLP